MDREVKSRTSEIMLIFIIVIAICGLGIVFLSSMVNSGTSDLRNVSVRRLQASVKGSIYAPGDLISVFGTCIDSFDISIANASAFLSVWYPNGTQAFSMSNMTTFEP
jgi:hypothetical protein